MSTEDIPIVWLYILAQHVVIDDINQFNFTRSHCIGTQLKITYEKTTVPREMISFPFQASTTYV